ncbi:MAG: hypothetical protein L6247_04975 [Desulfobacteraceae bacterium]|nr:hypothetical protein [Desulfobacteraceae bacterium]
MLSLCYVLRVKELTGVREKRGFSSEEEIEESLEKEALAFEKRNVDQAVESVKEPTPEPVKAPTGVEGKDAVSEEIVSKEQLKTEQEAIAEPKPEEVSEEVVERKEVASVESKVDEKIESLKEPIPEPVEGPPGIQEINELSKTMAEKIAASGEKTIARLIWAFLLPVIGRILSGLQPGKTESLQKLLYFSTLSQYCLGLILRTWPPIFIPHSVIL